MLALKLRALRGGGLPPELSPRPPQVTGCWTQAAGAAATQPCGQREEPGSWGPDGSEMALWAHGTALVTSGRAAPAAPAARRPPYGTSLLGAASCAVPARPGSAAYGVGVQGLGAGRAALSRRTWYPENCCVASEGPRRAHLSPTAARRHHVHSLHARPCASAGCGRCIGADVWPHGEASGRRGYGRRPRHVPVTRKCPSLKGS